LSTYWFARRPLERVLGTRRKWKEIGKLLDHLGYATPFIYAAATYGLFHWLDENLSDEAKAALASAMWLRDYDEKRLAPALVEVFDRIYTYPLLRWQAFFRSLVFTTILSALWLYEIGVASDTGSRLLAAFSLSVNIATDYLSLFIIRRQLRLSGANPLFNLIAGATIGLLLVGIGALVRYVLLFVYYKVSYNFGYGTLRAFVWPLAYSTFVVALPAMVVFAWLPLLAFGIFVVRTVKPLSWIVRKTQWFLKDGKVHPLRAVGYVAAAFVLVAVMTWQAIFDA